MGFYQNSELTIWSLENFTSKMAQCNTTIEDALKYIHSYM